jgi:hypothetical protein
MGTFQRPDSGNDETNTYEGRLTISESRRLPATDDLRAEIPTMIVLLVFGESMSSAMSSENREDVESEPASAESFPRPYHFSFSPASIPAAVSTPSPSVLKAAPGEGAYCTGDPITIILPTCNNYHAVTTTAQDAPLGLHHPADYLIAKHPKVVSTVSNVLIAVGEDRARRRRALAPPCRRPRRRRRVARTDMSTPPARAALCPLRLRASCPSWLCGSCPSRLRASCPLRLRASCPLRLRASCPSRLRARCPSRLRVSCPSQLHAPRHRAPLCQLILCLYVSFCLFLY